MELLISDAPKYKQIMRLLIQEIEDSDMEAHDRFYSESELRDKFKVSVPTIRMALKELIQEGLIYREHGRGTFVSPPTVKRQVLIVGRFDDSLPARDFGIMNFTQSFISDKAIQKRAYMPVAISSGRFEKIAPELRHYYPNATCVLFFRDNKVVNELSRTLSDQGIPFIFYGSDTFLESIGSAPSCVYPEKKIIELGVDYLVEKYGPEISFAYSHHTAVFESRFEHFKARVEALGIVAKSIVLPVRDRLFDENLHEHVYEYLNANAHSTRSIFCADDRFAILFHNAALRLGLKMPDDLALLGLNDYPICDMIYPTLSSIQIPIVEDGRRCLNALINNVEAGKEISVSASRVKLIERLSA